MTATRPLRSRMRGNAHVRFWSRAEGAIPSLRLTASGQALGPGPPLRPGRRADHRRAVQRRPLAARGRGARGRRHAGAGAAALGAGAFLVAGRGQGGPGRSTHGPRRPTNLPTFRRGVEKSPVTADRARARLAGGAGRGSLRGKNRGAQRPTFRDAKSWPGRLRPHGAVLSWETCPPTGALPAASGIERTAHHRTGDTTMRTALLALSLFCPALATGCNKREGDARKDSLATPRK